MTTTNRRQDGGYHALKGFVFQFDASLLRMYAEPNRTFQIEGDEDLSVDNYHTQIKHRSRKFVPSAISPAVRQMVSQFTLDRDRRFCLYCYFPDQVPGTELVLELGDLKKITEQFENEYSDEFLKEFCKAFTVKFSVDYHEQFKSLIEVLIKKHRLKTEAEAVHCHAIVQSHLLDLVMKNPPEGRMVSAADLIGVVDSAKSSIFHSAYHEMYGNEKYLKVLKAEFVQRKINVPKRERLFVVECSPGIHVQNLVDVAVQIKKKFHRKNESLPPYLIFRGVDDLSAVKQLLIDADVKIFDGTYFNGDRLRLADLTNPRIERAVELKISGEENISGIVGMTSFAEIYDFFVDAPSEEVVESDSYTIHRRFVQDTHDVAVILG
ncbi:hypothetical protein AB0451_16650 [Streptomyces sp. NPDC052000]|uniref:hypothetical protein n=1 Tax=Streptomyces sp. NPDC052000 TaxID=3155676 RepID=UPI00344FB1F5